MTPTLNLSAIDLFLLLIFFYNLLQFLIFFPAQRTKRRTAYIMFDHSADLKQCPSVPEYQGCLPASVQCHDLLLGPPWLLSCPLL